MAVFLEGRRRAPPSLTEIDQRARTVRLRIDSANVRQLPPSLSEGLFADNRLSRPRSSPRKPQSAGESKSNRLDRAKRALVTTSAVRKRERAIRALAATLGAQLCRASLQSSTPFREAWGMPRTSASHAGRGSVSARDEQDEGGEEDQCRERVAKRADTEHGRTSLSRTAVVPESVLRRLSLGNSPAPTPGTPGCNS
jgi:hypothetical protein